MSQFVKFQIIKSFVDNGNKLTNSENYWENYATHYQIVFANNDESAEPVAWKLSAED